MQNFSFIGKYLAYRFFSQTKHDVHPPFLFDLITRVFEDKSKISDYIKVENLKKELLGNNKTINVEDFGAGSSVNKGNQRTIGQIAKNSSKPVKYGRLLYRLVKYFNTHTILELGTSLGLSSAYMTLANPDGKVITIEGCPNISSVATENFKKLNIKNIELITGKFDNELTKVINKTYKIDFVFIDGNHRKEPTIKYFEQILQKTNNDSVLIFDDIHWSKGMEAAWKYVKNHTSVTLTVDIFFMGLVFLKKELSKENFIIRF